MKRDRKNKDLEHIEMEMWRLYRMGKIEDSERDPVIHHAEAMAVQIENLNARIKRWERWHLAENAPSGSDDYTKEQFAEMQAAWADLKSHGDIPEAGHEPTIQQDGTEADGGGVPPEGPDPRDAGGTEPPHRE